MSVKPVNRGLANEFQVWQRTRLASSVVMQDLDAWGIAVSDGGSYEPTALIELKRSYKEPAQWMPYPDDRPNYASLHRLAERAGIPMYVVYFKKGEEITDTTVFHVFKLERVVPEYRGRRRLMTAAAFAERFPRLWPSASG